MREISLNEVLVIFDPQGNKIYSGPPLHVNSGKWSKLCTQQEPYTIINMCFYKDAIDIVKELSYRHMKNGKVSENVTAIQVPLDDQVNSLLLSYLKH